MSTGGGTAGAQSGLASTVEALLFLSPDPVAPGDLRDACGCDDLELEDALEELHAAYAPGRRGLVLRELAGGLALSTAPEAEPAARRLLARPRTPPLSPAQAETLAIVAYLQPVSRPEISRIRGVAAEATCAILHERGLLEEAGRSPHGAVQYRTTDLFLRLFGLDGLADLPDTAAFDPSPEETELLRDRLLRAGSARGGDEAAARDGEGEEPGEAPAQLPVDGPPSDPAAGP